MKDDLSPWRPKPFKAIGKQFGISWEAARLIHDKALEKLARGLIEDPEIREWVRENISDRV